MAQRNLLSAVSTAIIVRAVFQAFWFLATVEVVGAAVLCLFHGQARVLAPVLAGNAIGMYLTAACCEFVRYWPSRFDDDDEAAEDNRIRARLAQVFQRQYSLVFVRQWRMATDVDHLCDLVEETRQFMQRHGVSLDG